MFQGKEAVLYMDIAIRVGRKTYFKRLCLNKNCRKPFYRSRWQVERGQDKFCSKACRYNQPDYEEGRRVKQLCTVCGIEVERLPCQADAKTPFCGHLCRQLYQDRERAATQIIYTPDLLCLMMEYEGENCAFPGCEEPQEEKTKKNARKNPYHVCTAHLNRINGALKFRARKRQKIVQAQEMLLSVEEIQIHSTEQGE